MDDFDKLKEQLDSKAVRIEDVNILFLDVSSTCVGYVKCNVDFARKTAKFLNAGSLYIPKVDLIEKCGFMYNTFMNYWNIIDNGVDHVIMEKFMINNSKLMGVLSAPMVQGALFAAFSDAGIKSDYIYCQSWRKTLGIKKNEKNDYKNPTKLRVLEYVEVPEKLVNNLTMNENKTSSDTYDALAISIAWLKIMNINNLNFNVIKFQSHVGILTGQGNI